MKLSDRKIESLAQKITAWMEKQRDIELLASAEDVARAIAEEFLDEKDLERQLDDEVDKVLEANEDLIRGQNVDSWVMRKKIRQQIARQKGIVL